MKITKIDWCLLASLLVVAPLAHSEDDLLPPVKIEAAGEPMELGTDFGGGHAAPFVADFDGDGKMDLLVGCFRGKLRIYRNEGSNSNPVFNTYSYFKAGGADVQVPCH